MAWMRMMGGNSVEYHRETVLKRGDDHPGRALDYYAERGESPLRWGGAGAARLGLEGHVSPEHYEDMFGVGGARDPITGTQLATTKRPGMELVVSAHKSVAELGVIGWANEMHLIMDAERDGTLAYLDALTRQVGGRRGKTAIATPTSGLVYAHTRHATSRAGDPCPHDHVLIVNAVEMLDDKGGWKAPDTTVWREHLHAATAYGRLCSAKVAVELGFGIVPDDGPSGRLGHWAIAGIPDAAMKLHSKRAADIAGELVDVGFDSYRAKGHAARNSRDAKRHQPVEDLMARWTAELETIGITIDDMAQSVEESNHLRIADHVLTTAEVQALVDELLGPDGRLAERKVFARRDVIVAAAPQLFGLDVDELDRIVDRVLLDPAAVPLIGVPGVKERVFVPACVLATEHAIAANVAAGRERLDAPRASKAAANQAMIDKQRSMGNVMLTHGQQHAITGIVTSGRGVDIVLGVAGAGKTTALDAVRSAFEAEGFRVVGTATSGQAARTLDRDAGITSSTLASLLWRLDHNQVRLDERTCVILDEAGMTDDHDMLRLLTAAADAGAKVVMVGDDRQLSAVGPGGSLGALIDRHEAGVWLLVENVRQQDPMERHALAELRAGQVDVAVDWMAANGRIVTGADRNDALTATTAGWARDIDDGKDTIMLAWRRANVDALNVLGRQVFADRGRLHGPELAAPGGRPYQAGDRIVTLAPDNNGGVVTSERGTIEMVGTNAGMAVRMADGRLQHFTAESIGKDRMAHGYAITVHRSQGATVDTAHRLEDGGGRELAYVSMSRARECSTVYAIADDVDQAVDDLKRDWPQQRRQRWAIDSGTPATTPQEVEAHPDVAPVMRHALRQARLAAEQKAITKTMPVDVTDELRRSVAQANSVRRDLTDLEKGNGRWERTPVREAWRGVWDAERRQHQAEMSANSSGGLTRRSWKKDAGRWADAVVEAKAKVEVVTAPHRDELVSSLSSLEARSLDLKNRAHARTDWLDARPDTARRLEHLATELNVLDRALQVERNSLDGVAPAFPDLVVTRHTRPLEGPSLSL